MKKTFVGFVSALIISFTHIGCEQTINIDIPYDSSKAALNSLIENDSIVYVRLTKPLSILHPNNNYQEIKNAKIDLYENAIFKETLKEKNINGKLYYVSNLFATIGNTYTLKASGSFGNIESTTTIPEKPEILSANYIYTDNQNNGKIQLKIKDKKNIKNYYLLKILWKEKNSNSSGESYFIIENLKTKSGGIFDDFIQPDPKKMQFFDDFEFDGKDEFTLILSHFQDNEDYVIQLYSLSESYFKYIQTIEQQRETKNDPLVEKVVIYSNIQGGFGIFGSANKSIVAVQ